MRNAEWYEGRTRKGESPPSLNGTLSRGGARDRGRCESGDVFGTGSAGAFDFLQEETDQVTKPGLDIDRFEHDLPLTRIGEESAGDQVGEHTGVGDFRQLAAQLGADVRLPVARGKRDRVIIAETVGLLPAGNVARDIAASRARRSMGQSAPGSLRTLSIVRAMRGSEAAVHKASVAEPPVALRTIASRTVDRADRMAAVPVPVY